MRPILKQLFASCAALLGLVLSAAAGAQTCSRAPAAEIAPAVAEEIARLNAAMAAASRFTVLIPIERMSVRRECMRQT